MILAKQYALRLIRTGKARIEGFMYDTEKTYVILTRLDLQRTDHYPVGDGDLR